MGFERYDDDHLQAVVEKWKNTPTTLGSMGDKAKRDSLAEWNRREESKSRHPAGDNS